MLAQKLVEVEEGCQRETTPCIVAPSELGFALKINWCGRSFLSISKCLSIVTQGRDPDAADL